MKFNKYDSILFIGDSITEWGRFDDPYGLGSGYVRLIHDMLVTTFPDVCLKVMNHGVSGDRITNLKDRWEEDAIKVNPNFISISIGVNDVWRRLDHPELEQIDPKLFEKIFRQLLTDVKEKTKAKIILMEPTIIQENPDSDGNQMLTPYVETVEKLATEFSCLHVPTHKAFLTFLKVNKEIPLTLDGVHMNSVGNMLMARTWIEAFGSWDTKKQGK